MAKVGDRELRQSLKNSELFNVYYVYGNDDFIKKSCVDALLKRFADGDENSFDLKKPDADGGSVESIINACQTLPLMSEYTCVLVTDFPFDSLSDDDFEKLKQFLNDIPETGVLIFRRLSEQSGKTQKQNAVIRLIQKVGAVVECNEKTGSELEKTVLGGIRKRGCTISTDALKHLIETVGTDLYLLLNETEKLTSYRVNSEITKADIDSVCVKSMEANAFDVTRAMLSGNSEKAFVALDELFALREEPMRILGAIISTYVDLYRAKVAINSGESCLALADTFLCYKGKDFRLKNAARNVSGVPIEKLRMALDELNRTDSLMKGSKADGKLLLQELTIRLIAL